MRLPPEQRPTAQQLAAQANGGGFVCPKCGGVLVAYKTITTNTRKIRYRCCRNPNCEARYVTKQQSEEIMREVSKDGKDELTGLRVAG